MSGNTFARNTDYTVWQKTVILMTIMLLCFLGYYLIHYIGHLLLGSQVKLLIEDTVARISSEITD